jgi:hypothetical protein
MNEDHRLAPARRFGNGCESPSLKRKHVTPHVLRHTTAMELLQAGVDTTVIALWPSVSWDQQFDDPIVLPGRKPLVTLRDAALYITKLPKAEHDADEWQAAVQALLLVAERNGPTMLARIGMMRLLNT